jgi:2-oxoglutarate ferredoxin oxidoreductase subunit gamma
MTKGSETRDEIRIAGFGGQGIVLTGYILGKAATIYQGLNTVFTQSYGPEARGGSCSADVILSSDTIYYPRVMRPRILVLMSEDAKNTYLPSVSGSCRILIDEDLVRLDQAPEGSILLKVPATRIAEKLGRKIVANIVMLGFVTAVAGLIEYDAMKKSILASIPKGTEELNLKAFEEGYRYGVDRYPANAERGMRNAE